MARELFAPRNLLETCQGLQEVIATAPADEKDTAGAAAKDMINTDQLHYYGATRLELRTLAAYALPDGLTFESQVWPVVRYGELRLNGQLAQVSYMRVDRVSTLSWMIAEPTIRHDYGALTVGEVGDQPEAAVTSRTDDGESTGLTVLAAAEPDSLPLPIGQRLRRPLYLPVGMIESVMVAA